MSGNAHYTIPMDTRKAPFDDNNVRQALKYAINREEMVEKILFGYGSVGNDIPIGPGQLYYNTELEQKTYDPDKAKWHLKEAGMDSLSVRHVAAIPFRLSYRVIVYWQLTASAVIPAKVALNARSNS